MSHLAVVVGAGFVGLATAVTMHERGRDVVIIDNDQSKVDNLLKGVVPFHEPGMAEAWEKTDNQVNVFLANTPEAEKAMRHAFETILCVQTPTQAGAPLEHDVSAVYAAAGAWARAQIEEGATCGYLVIKSTVLPHIPGHVLEVVRECARGALDDWHKMLYSPEFLAEGTALEDCRKPVRVIAGWVERDLVSKYTVVAWRLAQRLLMSPHYDTTSETASMVKYASNTMLASRLSTIQAIGDVCERVGGDIRVVSKALADDPRIGSQFLSAGAGWGGSCFPKDVRALRRLAHSTGAEDDMLATICQANDAIATRWVFSRISHYLTGQPRKIAWLGIAFKPGTSDTRDSPSLSAFRWARKLFLPTSFVLHDPEAHITSDQSPMGACPPIVVADSALDAVAGVDVIVLGTAWPEYRDILQELIGVASDAPLIIDSRNLWDPSPEDLPTGTKYIGFGRPPVIGIG